jgi:hypothetical protein
MFFDVDGLNIIFYLEPDGKECAIVFKKPLKFKF